MSSRSVTGLHVHIKHIADKIKKTIDHQDDISVGYLIQKLSYTHRQEVYYGMTHIADDLAVWFLRLSEKSPGFAIQEVYNLWHYAGKLHPELIDAFEIRKKAIIKNLLEMVIKKLHTQANQLIRDLISMGFNWSELHIIRDNLEKRRETD